jgi:hypothetical protein
VPAWAVPGESGRWTLRCHETMGGRGGLSLDLADGLAATPVDLRGEPADVAADAISPYELRSFCVAR